MKILIGFALSASLFAQTSALMPVPRQSPLDNNGHTITGACMYSYLTGTTTPQATYNNASLMTANANPMVIDGNGRLPAVYLTPVSYKIVFAQRSMGSCPATPGTVMWSQDPVSDSGIIARSALNAYIALIASSAGAGNVGFSQSATYPVSTVGKKLQQVISVTDAPFSAKCDGSTNDATAIQAAITAAPAGGKVTMPTSCVIASGLTIAKSLELSSGTPGIATAQLLAGANSFTMIAVTNAASFVRFSGIEFDANGHTGMVGVSVAGTSVSFDHVNWFGAFANPTTSSASLFESYTNTRVFGAVGAMTFTGSSNINTFTNASFYGAGVTMQNGISTTFNNVTMECGAAIVAFNWQGMVINGGDFENVAPCAHITQFIALGSPAGAAPVVSATVTGVSFGGNADYAVQYGPVQNLTVVGNSISTDLFAFNFITTGGYVNNRNVVLAPNAFNINSAGYDESKILTVSGGNPDTLASNLTALYFNPMLFSGSMPVPLSSHVPAADAALYWQNAYFHVLSAAGTGFPIQDMNCHPSSAITNCKISGNLQVTPQSGTNTDAVQYTLDNTHRVIGGENGVGAGQRLCGSSVDYAAEICTNDNFPVEFAAGAGGTRLQILPGTQGVRTVVTTFSGLGSCGSGLILEGTQIPISDSVTGTFGAIITGSGAFHVIAYCDGTNWRAH